MSELEITMSSQKSPTENPEAWKSRVPRVSEITRRIRGQLENTFFDVWVRGEISNLRCPSSGHKYFVLKDDRAQLKGVMFRQQAARNKFELEDGTDVLAHGTISVYEARGDYQLICDAIEPMGVGALQKAFEQLKLKLQKEGLFEGKLKKTLPALPQRIGIITSPTGAALQDILKVISRRFPNREIIVLPTSVQGEKAAPEIVQAFDKAKKWNQQNPESPIDVIISGRGGGSMEDLWPFNEEIVARAIFKCEIPVISAVGHEIDFTISDFVADHRAATPSAAAEIVLPKKEDLLYRVSTLEQQSLTAMKNYMEQLRLHLDHLSERLLSPAVRIARIKEDFRMWNERLINAIRNSLRSHRQSLQAQTQMLHSLSPLQVLGRGYSITHLNDAIVRNVKKVTRGDMIRSRVSDGWIESKVTETKADS